VDRMKEILAVPEFTLEDEDIKKISQVGDTWFFRAFEIPPLPDWDEQLKKERNVQNK
jgi:diketogulonate reductase-like aldo/keto reductase